MARQEGGQCSIGLVRARTAWLAGAAGAAIAVYRKMRRPSAGPVDDPRAEELRAKLDESRGLEADRAEVESAETPVDQAEPADAGDRRSAVHEQGRAAAEQMRRSSGR
jgi:hypothetical protein